MANVASASSIISAALNVTGNLDCAGDIEIKGTIDGDVKARNVRIDESGKVKGKIVADSAYVDGTVRGQIVAKNVALAGSANVRGDILHESLSIEAGAFLDGNCRRLKEADQAADQPQKERKEPAKPAATNMAAAPAG
ncbi:MAG: polymer-forming cytoskeletal protein [Alphaproteobacteria bacterium]|nr:polymer-forming cytoskeletal protein [Alphaproteobacteria bacterium]